MSKLADFNLQITGMETNTIQDGGRIVAELSITLNRAIKIPGVRIIRGDMDDFVSHPQKLDMATSEYTPAFIMITEEIEALLNSAIMDIYLLLKD